MQLILHMVNTILTSIISCLLHQLIQYSKSCIWAKFIKPMCSTGDRLGDRSDHGSRLNFLQSNWSWTRSINFKTRIFIKIQPELNLQVIESNYRSDHIYKSKLTQALQQQLHQQYRNPIGIRSRCSLYLDSVIDMGTESKVREPSSTSSLVC